MEVAALLMPLVSQGLIQLSARTCYEIPACNIAYFSRVGWATAVAVHHGEGGEGFPGEGHGPSGRTIVVSDWRRCLILLGLSVYLPDSHPLACQGPSHFLQGTTTTAS